MKRIIRFASAAVCAAACLAICAVSLGAEKFDPSLQKELVIADSVQPYDLNPHTASYASEAQVLTGLCEGLFSYNPETLEPVGALAESYTVSKDKLTWTFTIRQNAKFSGGQKITAKTIRDSWLTLLAPETRAPYASLLDCIAGAEEYRTGTGRKEDVKIQVKDDRTLEVTLKTPSEHLPRILCHHAFAAVLPGTDTWSGPFALDSRTETDIVLKKNPNYWDAKSVALPSIRVMLTDDDSQATYLYNIGRVHWMSGAIDFKRVLSPDTLLIAPLFSTEYLFFKTTHAPWDNKDLRLALLYATPWEELRTPYIIAAETLVFPLNGYPEVKGPVQDMEKAREHFAKAGYGEGGQNPKDGKTPQRPRLTLSIPDFESYRTQAEILAKAWTALGIDVLVTPVEQNVYMTTIRSSPADMLSYVWVGDFADPLSFLELFRGNSSLNDSGWKDPAYDALLDEAARLTDTGKRYKKLAEAEQLLLDSGVILPLSHTVSVNVIEKFEIGGWYDNPLDIHPLKNIYFTQGRPISGVAGAGF